MSLISQWVYSMEVVCAYVCVGVGVWLDEGAVKTNTTVL